MDSLDALTVAVAVAAVGAAAVVGWALGARAPRRHQSVSPPSRRWRAGVSAFVVLGAVAGAVTAPVVAVLWVVVGLNFLLGRRENVPFSTYPMFSRPPDTAWALQFEDPDGELVAMGRIGLPPNIVRKRFETELQRARAHGIHDLGAARRSAAAVVATLVEEHRPAWGPLAARPITIVLVEYRADPGGLSRVRIPVLETPSP
jgi:hypothetical protein